MQEQIQDQEIIQQVLQGRQQAYALLVERYNRYVYTLVMRYISSREEAEEVAQDVFVKAYRSLADFRGQCKFSTWLYTITNTTCISFLRKKKEQTIHIDEHKMSNVTDNSRGSDYSEKKSEKKMLLSAIAALPEADARIITLFYQHEQSLEEIASALDLTSNHVKVRLFRARKKLKEVLETNFASDIAHL